jgi:hypothetical protein
MLSALGISTGPGSILSASRAPARPSPCQTQTAPPRRRDPPPPLGGFLGLGRETPATSSGRQWPIPAGDQADGGQGTAGRLTGR